jgi:hypothetical protein
VDRPPLNTDMSLVKTLRRIGRYQRLKFVGPGWAAGGLAFALTAYWYPIDPLLSVVGLLPIVYVLAPMSMAWVAREIHRVEGPEPDVLCAVEHLGEEGTIVQAQRVRVEERLRVLNANTGLGTSLMWLLLLPAWCLPWSYVTRAESAIESSPTVAKLEAEGRSNPAQNIDNKRTKETSQQRDDSRAKENTDERPRRVTATKGRTSSDKGRGTASSTQGTVIEDKTGAEIRLAGTGTGGDVGGGKLTEAPKNGKLKLLVKDRLDPAEKYPVEYREAIRKWFLKRK